MASMELAFDDRWWAVLANPAFIARRGLSRAIKELAAGLRLDGPGAWRDVGCGARASQWCFGPGSLALNVKGWGRLVALCVCAPAQIAGVLLQKISGNRDLFLDSAVLARKT